MLVPIPGQLAPDVQAPSPTGLSYNYTNGANTRTQSESPVSELHHGGGGGGAGGGAQGEGGDDEYYSFDYPPVSAFSATISVHNVDKKNFDDVAFHDLI